VIVQSDAYMGVVGTLVAAEVTKNLTMASDPACLRIEVSTPEGRATGLVRDSVVSCLVLVTVYTDAIDHVLGGTRSTAQSRLGSREMTRKTTWTLPPPAEPVTEEYLASVTIGEREPLNDRIELVPFDPGWPSMFSLAAGRVRAALSERAFLIAHVGSTAVPGLSAKPIIDMVLAVEDSKDEGSYVPPLEAQGFILRAREPDWFEHRFLTLKSRDMALQLHVFSAGCEEIDRMLAFRDWLRTSESDRSLYESTKKALAARTWRHVQNYADAKSDIVRQILERAREGAAQQGDEADRP
jgi:GrpB-like predicted nucleotidyltransferase (UPF0157 family)